MCVQAHIVEQASQFLIIPLSIFLGGMGMVITAFLEILRRNSLGFAAFGTYGTFFISVGVFGLYQAQGTFFLPVVEGQQAVTALLGIASFIFMIVSAAICLLLPVAFLMLTIMFFLLSAGFRNTDVAKAAGWWGLVTAGVAMYCAAAFLFEDLWGKEILPIFYTKPYKLHAAQLFPRISHSDPRSVTAGVPYPGRPELQRGDNLDAAQTAPSLANLNRVQRGELTGEDHV